LRVGVIWSRAKSPSRALKPTVKAIENCSKREAAGAFSEERRSWIFELSNVTTRPTKDTNNAKENMDEEWIRRGSQTNGLPSETPVSLLRFVFLACFVGMAEELLSNLGFPI
jgi:hypothetical protein